MQTVKTTHMLRRDLATGPEKETGQRRTKKVNNILHPAAGLEEDGMGGCTECYLCGAVVLSSDCSGDGSWILQGCVELVWKKCVCLTQTQIATAWSSSTQEYFFASRGYDIWYPVCCVCAVLARFLAHGGEVSSHVSVSVVGQPRQLLRGGAARHTTQLLLQNVRTLGSARDSHLHTKKQSEQQKGSLKTRDKTESPPWNSIL